MWTTKIHQQMEEPTDIINFVDPRDNIEIPSKPPDEMFPGMMPTEICLSVILILLITANIVVVYSTRAYRVFN